MSNKEINEIIERNQKIGWVPEPDALKIFSIFGLKVPAFNWVKSKEDALKAGNEIKYPVVAKIVSPDVVHKSDVDGVIVGIRNDQEMTEAFDKLSKIKGFDGIIIEEMVKGMELIIGAKVDFQFGPVVLMGIGGTSVEIYKDTSIKMAPVTKDDVLSMVDSLKAKKLLTGYRGSDPVNLDDLSDLLIKFSELAMELGDVMESIDLNPVMCSSEKCVIADARIMLKK